jgi:alpha-methylacyl-CoA racemase
VAPVLSMTEARDHHHIAARDTFVTHDGIVQPAPAPRFSRTAVAIQRRPPAPGEHTDEVLADWGFKPDEIEALREAGAVGVR